MKKLINIDMTWDEIKRRAKNGASMSVLADLNGVNTNMMREIVAHLEAQTGEKLVFAPKEKAIKKSMKKQKIDHAKVVEMYEAGKTVKEIAAELQTYDQNIYNHIAKYKKEKAAVKEAPEQNPAIAEQKAEEAEIKPIPFIFPEKVKVDPGVLDVIETNVDDLRNEIRKRVDELALLKSQLESWEGLLRICDCGEAK